MSDASEEFADQLLITLDNLGHLIAMSEQHAKEYAQRGLDEHAERVREDFVQVRAEIQRVRDYMNNQKVQIAKLDQEIKDMKLEWQEYQRHLLNERNANGARI